MLRTAAVNTIGIGHQNFSRIGCNMVFDRDKSNRIERSEDINILWIVLENSPIAFIKQK